MLFLLLLLTTATALAVIVTTGAATARALRPEPAAPRPERVERLVCRILFVERPYPSNELTLDCVVVKSDTLDAGLPFAITVAPNGPPWFADAVEDMVVRWADDETVVRFEVLRDGDGDRIDARDERSRVRFDLRSVDLA